VGIGEMLAAAGRRGARAQVFPAQVVSVDWSEVTATVNIGGGVVAAQVASGVMPRPGETVWCLVTEEAALVVGKKPRPVVGTVSGAASGGFAPVTLDSTGESVQVAYAFGTTPASGWRVLISWDAGGHIVQRVTGEAGLGSFNSQSAPAPGGTGIPIREQTFQPVDSASARGGQWITQDVIQDASYQAGAYFYGDQIVGTLSASSTIVSVELNVIVLTAKGSPTIMIGTHGAVERGAVFTAGGLVPLGQDLPAGFEGYVDITATGFGDLFKLGTAFGIEFGGEGFRQLAGVDRPGSGGALRIRWRD
jgi:hypothetical protein